MYRWMMMVIQMMKNFLLSLKTDCDRGSREVDPLVRERCLRLQCQLIPENDGRSLGRRNLDSRKQEVLNLQMQSRNNRSQSRTKVDSRREIALMEFASDVANLGTRRLTAV